MPPTEEPDKDSAVPRTDDRGYYEHWQKWGPKLEAIRRQEADRLHGAD